MSSSDVAINNEKMEETKVPRSDFYGPINTASEDFTPLTDDEINQFFDDIDKDRSGYVDLHELEAKLHEVHTELAPKPLQHHLSHPARRDLEQNISDKGDGLHAFLYTILPGGDRNIPRVEFVERVKKWQVPSQKQTEDHDEKNIGSKLPLRRRVRAYWAVHGPVIAFTAFVVALQLAFGLWQGMIYVNNPQARAALGWGVIMAKLAAGVLYPTLFFMLLSMSRHFATWLRGSYWISKFVNWDLSQMFHIRISCAGLFFASMHAIGHLTGSMVVGSQPSRQEAVAEYLGPDAVPRPYIRYVRSLPGWTGLVAISLFWTISLFSMPWMRKRSYEIFQLGHLLMFPMIGLLCAHGTAQLLQFPMMGFFLAFPALLVIFERSWRIIRGFVMRIPAKGRVLDEETAEITCKHPKGQDWPYSAGQYIFLQIPALSRFQWHPFTISACRGDILQVHIKFDGDWTNKLRTLLEQNENDDLEVGIDGPFGAPAQRFYDYDYSIIVGGGIGITPFSAILTDLEESFGERKDPWAERRMSRSLSRPGSTRSSMSSRRTSRRNSRAPVSRRNSRAAPGSESDATQTAPKHPAPTRRVDFHWTVREKNNLVWFSDLLNRAISGAEPHLQNGNLELNINTHITAKRKKISTHVFRYLLDSYRTEKAPYSALTGLIAPSHFGRPDFDSILESHYEDLVKSGVEERKVGVFYCGAPVVGEILSDKCHMLTAQARDQGLKIRYDFLIEVFG